MLQGWPADNGSGQRHLQRALATAAALLPNCNGASAAFAICRPPLTQWQQERQVIGTLQQPVGQVALQNVHQQQQAVRLASLLGGRRGACARELAPQTCARGMRHATSIPPIAAPCQPRAAVRAHSHTPGRVPRLASGWPCRWQWRPRCGAARRRPGWAAATGTAPPVTRHRSGRGAYSSMRWRWPCSGGANDVRPWQWAIPPHTASTAAISMGSSHQLAPS